MATAPRGPTPHLARPPGGTLRTLVAGLTCALGFAASSQAAQSEAPAPAGPSPAANASAAPSPPPGFKGALPGLPPAPMDTVVVTASRTPQPPERVAATTHVFSQAALLATPAATVDATLRTAPSFSLFRRSDSLTANPTAQGVSLRGLGPSGASRSLVLLDGIPLNDPFGGWVSWSKIPREAIARIEVVPGGGATAWGNAALGGTIQILTVPPELQFTALNRPSQPAAAARRGTAQGSVVLGDFGLRSAAAGLTRAAGPGVVQVFAEDFHFDGFSLIAPEARGPVDVAAWSRHRSVQARFRASVGTRAELTMAARGFEEFRGNGTRYQRNGTREKFATVQLAAGPDESFTWNAAVYGQAQSFASTFSAVNAARSAETPASDQYAVPATALGASWTGVWTHGAGARTSGGIDVRRVQGETRENYGFIQGAFTRERVAGGSQQFLGAFALHERALSPDVRLTAGARLDRWRDEHGHRREGDRASGLLSRDERDPSRQGFEFSPTAGLVWSPRSGLRLRANIQRSFRRPTLNELYRPFRQGPNITEANAGLRTERATSAEVGAETTLTRASPAAAPVEGQSSSSAWRRPWLKLGGTIFWNELSDAVANVTVARGPGTSALFGTLPRGGVGRQRLNLDRTVVQGAELTATWFAGDAFDLAGSYVYNDATVRRARVAPGLVHKRLAEVPRHSGSLTGTWKPAGTWTLTMRVRGMGRQFDDDENTLGLAEVVIADVGVSRILGRHLALFLNVENVADARIETARTADGVVSIGTGRFTFGGIRGRW